MPHSTIMDQSTLGLPIFEDIVVHDHLPSREEVIEVHEPSEPHGEESLVVEVSAPDLEIVEPTEQLEVEENLPEGTDLVVLHHDHDSGDPEAIAAIDFGGDLPGAPDSPEPEVEIMDEEEESSNSSSNSKSDSNDLKKADKWDWKAYGLGNFKVWVKERFDSVPKHSGYDVSGLERAHAYLEKLHGEISKAMRSDLEGELEAEVVAELHDKIEEGLEKLEERMDKVKQSKDSRKKKADLDSNALVKEGQKIFGVQSGVVVMVPLFISSLARVLVNGMVSSGKDIEDSYAKLVKKFKLTDRERMELIQLLQDMGLPMIKDRGLLPEEGFDPRSSDNFDYGSNYQA